MTEYTYFRYYKDVNDNSKTAVKTAVQNFKNSIKKNKNFLKGFDFHIVNSYKDLKKQSRLTTFVQEHSDEFGITGGLTVSAASNGDKKEIIINVNNNGISSIWAKNKDTSAIKQATMHEIGHQFDDYFGSCKKDLVDKIRKMPVETDSEEDERVMSEYLRTKDLSDTKEFKLAWKQDVEKLNQNSLWDKCFNRLPFEYTPYDIDITDGVTDADVEESDNARSEIFAQLFSYAMGEDDGQKDVITKKYKNSYKLVKSYIQRYLGIECE